jgi:hypothetical protein
MPAPQFDAVKEATDAFALLFKRRNWLLGAPQVAGLFLILILVFVVIAVSAGPQIWRGIISNGAQTPDISPGQIVALALSISIGVLLAIAVSMFTYAWTLVAAEPCWLGQDPAWDRGFNRAAAKVVTLAAYVILVFLMTVVSIITIVGPIIIGFLTMYGPAYILFGNRTATAAIGDSFRLASENIAPSLILVLAFIVVYMMGFMVNLVLGWLPLIGLFVGMAFQWLFSAYIALAIVRFYDILNASSGAPPFPIVPETNV